MRKLDQDEIDKNKFEEDRAERLAKLQNALEKMHSDIMRKSESKNNGKQTYLKLLDDIIAFVDWTNIKYDFRYDGNNSRVVKRGEIYYCELGINVGSEQSWRRPVIVLQNNTGNEKGPTTIVAPITNTQKRLPVHVPIASIQSGLVTTGVIRLEHMKEISKSRLGIFIEKIDPTEENWSKIDKAIKISLDLK